MKDFFELREGLVKVTDVEFDYRDQLPNSPKTSDIGAISSEWKQDRTALRDAVKKMGGLVTDTVAPSRGNKWVGTVTIGTRDDPKKLDDKSIQKAVKSHGIEIHSNQFRESTDLEEVKVKDFFELREAKVSAQFTDHTPDKDFNNLAKKHKVKVTHDKNDEKTTIHGDENAVLSVLKTMYGNDWKDMYTKKGSTYVDESVKTEDKGQFIYAAKQAKKKGDSTFVFAGKTYNCEEVLENENLDEAVNMGPWNRGAINKAMGKAGIKGKMAKDFIAALRVSGTVDEK